MYKDDESWCYKEGRKAREKEMMRNGIPRRKWLCEHGEHEIENCRREMWEVHRTRLRKTFVLLRRKPQAQSGITGAKAHNTKLR